MVATARAVVENPGLSIISRVETYVYLDWASERRPPTLILSLVDATDSSRDTNV